MKRTVILLIMMVFTLVSAESFADVLTIDLDQATMEELLAARDAVDQAIAERTKTDEYTIHGKESETQTVDIVLPPLSRLVVKSNDSDARCTIVTEDGKNRSLFWNSLDCFENEIRITQVTVDAKKSWELYASPIGETDNPFISGHGNEVSDRFQLSELEGINVVFDYSAGGGCFVNESCSLILYSVDESGMVHPQYLIMSAVVYEGKTTSINADIKLDPFAVSYFWVVKCNSRISWTISELPADQ